MPPLQTNASFGPYEVDLFWPDVGLGIEVDGRAYHSSSPSFENDRRKDNWLRARGIQVIRVTWRQITRQPTATVVQVGQALALAQERLRQLQAANQARSGPSGRSPP